MKAPVLLYGDQNRKMGMLEFDDATFERIDINSTELKIDPIIDKDNIVAWALYLAPIVPVFERTRPTRTMMDDRPITMLSFPFADPSSPNLDVGSKLYGTTVTKIVPYEEPGEMGPVLWYAVYGARTMIATTDGSDIRHETKIKGPEEIIYRIQAKYVESVGYQECST